MQGREVRRHPTGMVLADRSSGGWEAQPGEHAGLFLTCPTGTKTVPLVDDCVPRAYGRDWHTVGTQLRHAEDQKGTTIAGDS